jgi:hypothetical protein
VKRDPDVSYCGLSSYYDVLQISRLQGVRCEEGERRKGRRGIREVDEGRKGIEIEG